MAMKRIDRAVSALCLFLVMAAIFIYFYPEEPARASHTSQRVIVLGFDAIDPDLLEGWMDEGRLPNLDELRRTGSYYHLNTTNPAESPVAWSSFSTGMNPGKTNIFDFLRRNASTYMPKLAVVEFSEAEFFLNLIPVKMPEVRKTPSGT